MTEWKIDSVFTYKGRICVIAYGVSTLDSWRCGYVKSKFKKDYSNKIYYNLSEEPTYSGNLNETYPEVEDGHYIGFDTNHHCDTPETQSLEAVSKRLMKFADTMVKVEETTTYYKNRPCYLAGPIQHFSDHRELYVRIKNDPKKLKEYLFANWSEAYSWAIESVLELKEQGFIKVFSPHLYTILYAKRIYDTVGDDRDYWIAINFNIIEMINEVGGFMLVSNKAFSRVQGELIWHSNGTKEEWEYCKKNNMDCLIYEAFIEGDIVPL